MAKPLLLLLLLLAGLATVKLVEDEHPELPFYNDLHCDKRIGSDREHMYKNFVMLVHKEYVYFFFQDCRVRMKLPKVSSSVTLNKFLRNFSTKLFFHNTFPQDQPAVRGRFG